MNPPSYLQALNSAFRSCVLESDRVDICSSSQENNYTWNSGRSKTFAAVVKQLDKAYYFDWSLKAYEHNQCSRRSFKGYSNEERSYRKQSTRRIYTYINIKGDAWIICTKINFYSSNQQQKSYHDLKNTTRAYFSGEDNDESNIDSCKGTEEEESD